MARQKQTDIMQTGSSSIILTYGSGRLLLLRGRGKKVSGTFTCPITALPVSYCTRLNMCTALSTFPPGHPGLPAATCICAHSEHRFPAPQITKTLPDLVMSLKRHSLSPRNVHWRGQRPTKGLGTNEAVEATYRPNAREHETYPQHTHKTTPSRFKRFWFYLCWRKQCGQL